MEKWSNLTYKNTPECKSKCKRENQSFFRYIIGLKPKECFCSGKLKYDCGNEMCAFDKTICEFLFDSDKNLSILLRKAKKCT